MNYDANTHTQCCQTVLYTSVFYCFTSDIVHLCQSRRCLSWINSMSHKWKTASSRLVGFKIMSRLLHTSITVFSGRLISDKQIILPLLSPHLQSCSNTGAVIMLSDLSAAAQSCCGKWEACRPPWQIIEGSQWWQRCFLIEDLMLLCIQEADVGLSTISKDSRARARIWTYWSVRKGEWQDGAFRCFWGIGHRGHMSQAGLWLWRGVYLICKRRFIVFFFIGEWGFRLH